jgi:hypothetical protein
MWIFMNDAMISIVEHRDDSDKVFVRARKRGDLQNVFGQDAEVIETADADYRFRIIVPKKTIAEIIFNRIINVDYDNFKNSVNEYDRSRAYHDVWEIMYGYQATSEYGINSYKGNKKGDINEIF